MSRFFIFLPHIQPLCFASYHRSPDEAHISNTAPELRDVFGESDDEEAEEYNVVQNHLKDNSNVCNNS